MKNITEFALRKREQKKISMTTCYDSWTAKIIESSPVDCILVGDSCMMTMHGQIDTVNATIDILALHAQAVRRGAPTKFIICDMPFLEHRISLATTMIAVRRLMSTGVNAVKIEGVEGSEETLRYIVESGVPVMGHLGLTPQSLHALGGFRLQATDPEAQRLLESQALRLEKLGIFALVLECVPASIAEKISKQLRIPVIGIGAGVGCDGQVLVLQDLLGADPGFKPKFVRRYANLHGIVSDALSSFCQDVTTGLFPSDKESFTSKTADREKLRLDEVSP